jgi:membrane glycosyltransferase
MLVLDADSRMTPRRIRRMIWQMERRPASACCRPASRFCPGRTRFGRHQRVAARLLSRGFRARLRRLDRGQRQLLGPQRDHARRRLPRRRRLPVLSGTAPWGGALSHDFIEAAWIRRAGWAVALDPDTSGSAEEAPQTSAAFHARDRRWCQGNLQHLRLIAEPGLDPVSRLHLAWGS